MSAIIRYDNYGLDTLRVGDLVNTAYVRPEPQVASITAFERDGVTGDERMVRVEMR